MRAKKPASTESQIKALEYALANAVNNNKPSSQIFALNNKLKTLRQKNKMNDWLAK